MALQSSGAISLNEMHIEAGGSTGSNCTINDSDIRDLISKSSGAAMSFNEWYGASAGLSSYSYTMTNGTYTSGTTYPGFDSAASGGTAHGSLSNNPQSTALTSGFNPTWTAIRHSILKTNQLDMTIGSAVANSGWTSITFSAGGITSSSNETVNRSAMTYQQIGSLTQWYVTTSWTMLTSGTTTVTINV